MGGARRCDYMWRPSVKRFLEIACFFEEFAPEIDAPPASRTIPMNGSCDAEAREEYSPKTTIKASFTLDSAFQ